MRKIVLLLLLAILVYVAINARSPWECERVEPPLLAETHTGSYLYTSFTLRWGPSGKRSYFGGYPATIHEKCVRISSVVYAVTVVEGFGAMEGWMKEADLKILNNKK